jgi:hypothetical protein
MKKVIALLFSFALVFGFSTGAFASSGDKNCSDFKTWSEAQNYFESKGGSKSNNVDGLDRNRDGIACESLAGYDQGHENPNDKPKEEPTPTPEPKPTPEPTNGGQLPTTAGSNPNFVVIGALLLIAGTFALKMKPSNN